MGENKNMSAIERILAALAEGSAVKHYTLDEIEALPIDEVQARLRELGAVLTMPAAITELVQASNTPTQRILDALSADEAEEDRIEHLDINEVRASLDDAGVDYQRGLEIVFQMTRAKGNSEQPELPCDAEVPHKAGKTIATFLGNTINNRRKQMFVGRRTEVFALLTALAASVCFIVIGKNLVYSSSSMKQIAMARRDGLDEVIATADRSGAAQQDNLLEIIVTARKRSEDIQKVPASITMLSGNDLTKGQVLDYQSLVHEAPGTSAQDDESVPTNQQDDLEKLTITAVNREDMPQPVPITMNSFFQETLIKDYDDISCAVPGISFNSLAASDGLDNISVRSIYHAQANEKLAMARPGSLEEIIVRANRSASENVQAVPMAISVINPQAIEYLGMTGFEDYSRRLAEEPRSMATLPSDTPAEPRSVVAMAQQNDLEEILFAVQRRSQDIKDIPIGISALSGYDIQAKGIRDYDDFSRAVPRVSQRKHVRRKHTHSRSSSMTASQPAGHVDGLASPSDSSGSAPFDR